MNTFQLRALKTYIFYVMLYFFKPIKNYVWIISIHISSHYLSLHFVKNYFWIINYLYFTGTLFSYSTHIKKRYNDIYKLNNLVYLFIDENDNILCTLSSVKFQFFKFISTILQTNVIYKVRKNFTQNFQKN